MWNKFDSDRDFKINNGVLVVRPNDKDNVIPLFCPVCEFSMQTADDFLSYKEVSCCFKCKVHLAAQCVDEWKAGKRPDKNSEEYKKYIDFRKQTFKPIIRFW